MVSSNRVRRIHTDQYVLEKKNFEYDCLKLPYGQNPGFCIYTSLTRQNQNF